MSLVDYVEQSTHEYINLMPKSERKRLGQFFTGRQTAEFMAGLFEVPAARDTLSILEPGAGTGILSASLIQRLEGFPDIKNISLLCYETDENILPLLDANLRWLSEHTSLRLSYRIEAANYILSQAAEYNETIFADEHSPKHDLIICNPPYMKAAKDSPEAQAMPDVCCGAPNLYFLFASMSLFNLRDNGEMVYIIPRSWTSGAYFEQFRKRLFTDGALKHIHIFASRDEVFKDESILQETLIIKLQRTTAKPETITITSTQDSENFSELSTFKALYDAVISGRHRYVYLPVNDEDIMTLKRVQSCEHTLADMGLRMKTGLVVEFRHRDLLRECADAFTVPIFYPHNIQRGSVVFPTGKKPEYITLEREGLLQRNDNYLFVKRFTSKEEHRRLQCGIYSPQNFSGYDRISTDNKLNFIAGPETVINGLYVIFNSTLYDNYYRLLNGSTQVNATEINNMPVPSFDVIEAMGRELVSAGDLSVNACDEILGGYL